jgi:signal transduction histidine kinase
LGLAIARQLAEFQDGQLTVRNHPGSGAEFQLTFPLNFEID